MRYEIHNTIGIYLGTWEAPTEEAALDAMAETAGYASYSAFCAAVPAKPGEIEVRRGLYTYRVVWLDGSGAFDTIKAYSDEEAIEEAYDRALESDACDSTYVVEGRVEDTTGREVGHVSATIDPWC